MKFKFCFVFIISMMVFSSISLVSSSEYEYFGIVGIIIAVTIPLAMFYNEIPVFVERFREKAKEKKIM